MDVSFPFHNQKTSQQLISVCKWAGDVTDAMNAFVASTDQLDVVETARKKANRASPLATPRRTSSVYTINHLLEIRTQVNLHMSVIAMQHEMSR